MNLLEIIKFKKGNFLDESFNAYTKYEVDEECNFYNIEVVFNSHFFDFSKRKQTAIIVHELTHCSFYQMHADKILNDEEVICLNEMIDVNYPTLYFVQDDTKLKEVRK